MYRVDGALVEADLMRRLRVRGSARGGDAGIADVAAAHRLCQGTPLDRRRTGGYSWAIDANLSDLTDHYLRSMTDIGHVLVAHYLQRGEPQAAIEVCQQSLLAGAVDPTTRCNLIRAYRDLGNEAAAERQVQKLVDSYDVEDEVALPPDVFAMLYGGPVESWLNQRPNG